MAGRRDHACDILGPPFQAVDAQEMAKAIAMQHPMQEVHRGVEDGHRSYKGGPCTALQLNMPDNHPSSSHPDQIASATESSAALIKMTRGASRQCHNCTD